MLTGAQIRAARSLLGLKQSDLARMAGLSEPSIKAIEREKTDARMSTMRALREALESAGVEFTPQDGVRRRLA